MTKSYYEKGKGVLQSYNLINECKFIHSYSLKKHLMLKEVQCQVICTKLYEHIYIHVYSDSVEEQNYIIMFIKKRQLLYQVGFSLQSLNVQFATTVIPNKYPSFPVIIVKYTIYIIIHLLYVIKLGHVGFPRVLRLPSTSMTPSR